MRPIFTTPSFVSSCLPSKAHLFLLWSHDPISALCLNKVAWVQINDNWCCQCRNIAKILGALVIIQHSSRQNQPLKHCTILPLLCGCFAKAESFHVSTLMKCWRLSVIHKKRPYDFKMNHNLWHWIGFLCVDEASSVTIYMSCNLHVFFLLCFNSI